MKINKDKLIKILIWYTLTGICVVFGRRILSHGFTKEVFTNDFISEFIIGVSTAIIVGICANKKSIEK